jgi:exosome complex RNA-binding protein Csl4
MPGSATMSGEVRSVDTRRARLQLRDDYNGRTETLRYDDRTRVVYRNQQYPVSALERGDIVRVRVVADRGGERWADLIEVRQNVRDRSNASRTQRLDGTVTQVDARRRYFTLTDSRRDTFVISVPGNISRDDARRFERVRRGDRVRADVRLTGPRQGELVRFR